MAAIEEEECGTLANAASAEEDGDQVAEAEPPPRTSVQMQIKGWSYELDL